MRTLVRLMLAGGLFAACGSDNTQCNPNDSSSCDNGQVCEAYTDGAGMHNACVAPTLLRGHVTNAQSGAAVANARVVAIDGNTHASTGPVAITDAAGNYSIRVTPPRMSGASTDYTLRVSAAAYEDFPSGIRVALPITVAFQDPKGAATITGPEDVALVPIANAPAGAIAGSVSGDKHAGVLVVAEGGGKGFSAVTDGGGGYVIFNVPDGTYTVSGYFIGVEYTPAQNVVVAGARKDGVNLAASGAAQGVLTGTLDYVAGAPTAQATSVVLRLQSTKEVPPGFSAPAMNATAYTLSGVPAGTYDVLAAFPNDGLIKDPDPGIAGTAIPTAVCAGASCTCSGGSCSFKVTDPVAMGAPDADAIVMGTPMFTWTAYPSAAKYTIDVFDSQGNPVCTIDNIAAGSASQVYGGTNCATLTPGLFYQWHITAFRQTGGTYIPTSTSEDLRGVWQQK